MADIHPHYVNTILRNVNQASRCLARREPVPSGAAWGFIAGVILALAHSRGSNAVIEIRRNRA